jgi:hypothetical protein
MSLKPPSSCSITHMELKKDSPLDGYLEPKFPIVKSSLVQGEEPWNLFEMRNLRALLCVLQACGSQTFPRYVSFIAVLINFFTSYSL